MLTLTEMTIRFVVAVLLGALIGLERELVGKEAGMRTGMMVAGGAAIFSIISLTLPYIVAVSAANLPDVIARNSGFLGVIANIVVGVGFLGAGIIIKTGEHVRGLTTAAIVWVTAAIGTLAGIGLMRFAIICACIIVLSLYTLRKIDLYKRIRPPKEFD